MDQSISFLAEQGTVRTFQYFTTSPTTVTSLVLYRVVRPYPTRRVLVLGLPGFTSRVDTPRTLTGFYIVTFKLNIAKLRFVFSITLILP